MVTSPSPYHPPKISECQRPQGEHLGYIEGPTGRQGFGSREFFVALIPCRLAREVIIKHHYSQRIANNSYLHWAYTWGFPRGPTRSRRRGVNEAERER